jgi:hypothetical protein
MGSGIAIGRDTAAGVCQLALASTEVPRAAATLQLSPAVESPPGAAAAAPAATAAGDGSASSAVQSFPGAALSLAHCRWC